MKSALPMLALVAVVLSCTPEKDGRYTMWQVTGGSKENIRYSVLDQMDTTNVSQLKVAWTYHTLDADTINHSEIQCNPIIVDGVLYGTSARLRLIALDAGTGAEKWVFNPHESKSKDDISKELSLNNNRGVTYWKEGEDKRIFYSVGPY